MLKTRLLHPEILAALARGGHGSRVLIGDGNYPYATGVNAAARVVFLNLARDRLSVPDVLQILIDTIPIEGAMLMAPAEGGTPDVHRELAGILGEGVPVETRARAAFYAEARGADTCLTIATGESRRFANVLLTIGVVR